MYDIEKIVALGAVAVYIEMLNKASSASRQTHLVRAQGHLGNNPVQEAHITLDLSLQRTLCKQSVRDDVCNNVMADTQMRETSIRNGKKGVEDSLRWSLRPDHFRELRRLPSRRHHEAWHPWHFRTCAKPKFGGD